MLCCHCSPPRQTFKNKFIRQTVNNTISASSDRCLDLFDISVLKCGDLINFSFISVENDMKPQHSYSFFYAFKKRSSWLVFENLVIKKCFIFKSELIDLWIAWFLQYNWLQFIIKSQTETKKNTNLPLELHSTCFRTI